MVSANVGGAFAIIVNGKIRTLLSIVGVLVIIQSLLFGIKQLVFVFVERTNFSDSMASMIAMLFLTLLFVLFAKKRAVSLSVFPRTFNKFYIIGSCVAVALLVSTPSNYTGDIQAIAFLIFASVVTPIFEELIFRGYVWNKLNIHFENEWKTFLVTSILFGLWHLGYIDSIAFRVETGLANAMFWKVITGLCFGIVLGVLRLKTKNSYSTILLHGVMNIFGS
jgi:membrane protease YdiL (CAAX protease family)